MAQRSVEIETADGISPAALSIPGGEGPWPAVIMFPDAGGMRDTMRQMGERLSDLGYLVLVPDFYYRNGPYDPVDMRTAFSTKETAEKIMGMMRGYTADLVVRDAGAFVRDPAFTAEPFTIHTRWIETEFAGQLPSFTGPVAGQDIEPPSRERITVEVGGKRLEVVLPAALL